MSKLDFTKKPIIGMIHLSGDSPEEISNRAFKEIGILMNEGIDGIIVENYHGDIDSVTKVLETIQVFGLSERGLSVGINILPNEYQKAFELAKEYKADFIQLDYVAGNYENTKDFNSNHFLSLRNNFPDIQILGGVWPKYYKPVKYSDLEEDLLYGMNRTDAIVVTGQGTGKETPLSKIKQFRYILGEEHSLIIGAGLDASNVAEQLPFADGAIVGSCFKPYKRTQEMIDKNLVREFMNEVKKIR